MCSMVALPLPIATVQMTHNVFFLAGQLVYWINQYPHNRVLSSSYQILGLNHTLLNPSWPRNFITDPNPLSQADPTISLHPPHLRGL